MLFVFYSCDFIKLLLLPGVCSEQFQTKPMWTIGFILQMSKLILTAYACYQNQLYCKFIVILNTFPSVCVVPCYGQSMNTVVILAVSYLAHAHTAILSYITVVSWASAHGR